MIRVQQDSRPVLSFKRLSCIQPALPLPDYASDGASGFDLRADIESSIEIPAGSRMVVPTGLAMAVPVGFEVQVRPRSGLAARHGVTVLNSPGTIDSDYRGEVMVILINLGDSAFRVNRGDRIAQAVIAPSIRAIISEAGDLDETARGAGGFGSTGIG